MEVATQRLFERTSALSLRAEEAAAGSRARNAAESFFFANFIFCGKKESGERKKRK